MSNHWASRGIRKALFLLGVIRLLPHVALWRLSPRRELINQDVRRWAEAFMEPSYQSAPTAALCRLLLSLAEYRTLFYCRLGRPSKMIMFLCPPLEATTLVCPDLGPGLVIQHGFATIIVAERMGARCWVNQQVTIGAGGSKPGFPRLGDEVHVGAGAKIIGGVTVGDRVTIGANAVIVKDVPSDVTVVGVPAYIVRRNGVRVHEKL